MGKSSSKELLFAKCWMWRWQSWLSPGSAPAVAAEIGLWLSHYMSCWQPHAPSSFSLAAQSHQLNAADWPVTNASGTGVTGAEKVQRMPLFHLSLDAPPPTWLSISPRRETCLPLAFHRLVLSHTLGLSFAYLTQKLQGLSALLSVILQLVVVYTAEFPWGTNFCFKDKIQKSLLHTGCRVHLQMCLQIDFGDLNI
ncbi:hypothetical protein Anapl_10997 [Anas platyrhynchos]|uniref:Uncharacterized protein n=1 Tax=Anas platyrhynchos TaxID=8839 RepID=R0L5B2_ANAPL|nr:hypothetical protein Anapl_10997 [Anas platyrhynchos]